MKHEQAYAEGLRMFIFASHASFVMGMGG